MRYLWSSYCFGTVVIHWVFPYSKICSQNYFNTLHLAGGFSQAFQNSMRAFSAWVGPRRRQVLYRGPPDALKM
jgi:hypothetical protein